MIKIFLIFATLLFPVSLFASNGVANLAAGGSNISFDSAITNIFNELILPNLPGATLLLAICVLISTLTFFADLKRNNLPGRGSIRYLLLWIFGNYSFALVLLVLIIPEGTRLDQLDRTLLLYCLIASGLPEMSAYMKIQIGNSNKGVNLYKIREMFTGYIARQVNLISENTEWHELQLFKYAFIGKASQLNEKLIAFTNLCEFTDAEKHEILACLPSANNNDLDTAVGCLMSLNSTIKRKLFSFFGDDIRRYQTSSSARLVKNLYPPISAMEAQSLVMNGIVSPLRFLMRTIGNRQRNKLSSITHIENDKLALLHNELRGVYRTKMRRFIMGIFIFMLFIALASFILGKQTEITQQQQFENISQDDTVIPLKDLPE